MIRKKEKDKNRKIREDNKREVELEQKDKKRSGHLSYLINRYFNENDRAYLVDLIEIQDIFLKIVKEYLISNKTIK